MKKLDAESNKLLLELREKANKKNFGQPVLDRDIIKLSLSLITPEHIKSLQDASLSEMDRLKMAFENYCKTKAKITFDEFIGKLLRGEVKDNTNP